YVVPAGAPAAERELREHLAAHLPEHMVPSALVALDALPLGANGKVDRARLPAPGEAPRSEEHVAPRTPAEEVLAGIWREVLRADRVGVHDSFFELGGDSILGIQVVARARAAGLHLTPRQVFEHPTVAALAAAAGAPAAGSAEQGTVVGEVELTPVQAWFLGAGVPDPHHFNLSQLFEARRPLDGAALERALGRVLEHHDALRMRFRREGAGWRQENAAPDGRVVVTRADLSGLDGAAQRAALEAAAARMQASLRLEEGPLLRAASFHRGEGRSGRLLVVVHHLVTDGVSWRILLEDLQAAYEQAARGEPPRLPPKTTSFREWAARLAEHARSGGFDAELPYWTSEARRDAAPLPADFPAGDGPRGEAGGAVAAALDADETRALLQEAPRAYRTQANDLLLAALARAVEAWTGGERVLVEMEGHGREELFPGVELSRTVGWFTTLYPVVLDLGGARGPAGALRAVKEQLRAVPGRGIGHGALRYLGSPEARARLDALPEAQLRFEYLGQFDGSLAGDSLLALAPESAGPAHGPGWRPGHLLSASGAVVGGRLHLTWGYDAGRMRRETVEGLAARFVAELRALVAHCTSPGAGGFTPSDFPLAALTQAELDAVLAGGREVEDVYALSPTQEGLLFHSLAAPGEGAYVGQFAFGLEGELDPDAFERAWRGVLERHAALRTGFAWEGLDSPVQVVRRGVRLPVHREDWRGLPDVERAARRAAYLRADLARGFDVAEAPLTRLALFRVADRRWELVWTQHHLVLDGWSLPLVLRDVAALYGASLEGRPAELPPVRPYRDYVAWLRTRDRAEAERFWRGELAGFRSPTPLGTEPAGAPAPGHARETLRLAPDAAWRIAAAGRRLGLTANTLVQGAWALLLSRYAGEDDVVFGAALSGRPPEVEGVEEMVGLFINTLPLRARVSPGERVEPWLRALQERGAALREHQHTPLTEVQRWSGVPAGTPLFESLLVFENYPVPEALGGGGARQVRVEALEG
ncbi:MAG TPA: condensation domain-containing protein, partial [Longimicrobiaceae bacterium]|nr:condensation domain-containing protein [Longimicrobiaceae bacterium]